MKVITCTKLKKGTWKSIEFRWWQTLLCEKVQFIVAVNHHSTLCFVFVCVCVCSLSLSFFISFTVSVRCCSVQCRVWPHVLWTGNYVNTILLVMLLLHCHFFTSRSVYTVTAWYYGQSRQWVDLLQFQKLSTYIHTSVFLTLRHLDPYCT